MPDRDLHVIVIGAGITGLLVCQGLKKAGIRYTCFEMETSMNYRSNEWTMAIHWALPLLKEILPEEVYAKLPEIACNPTMGIHSGLYPIIHGETGDLITGVPYTDGLRVPRSKMRALCSEGIDVQYGKKLVNINFDAGSDGVVVTLADNTEVSGSMVIGADGARSRAREIAMSSAEKAAVTKFPIFHTNMTLTAKFLAVSGMPHGLDHPETWIFHMAMAWLGEGDVNAKSYPERLELIKKRAQGLADPARSAFMWMPDDTEVHKADISYWITQPWNNRAGKLTLVGDAAHPMPPYRGQGLNHCICDVSHLIRGLTSVYNAENSVKEAINAYEKEMVPRGKEEVNCSVENGLMLHNWDKIQESPVFQRGFKPMEGLNNNKENHKVPQELSH